MIGVTLLVGFIVTLPSGMPDLSDGSVASLAPFAAVGGIFFICYIVPTLGLSGYAYYASMPRNERRAIGLKHPAAMPTKWFYLTLWAGTIVLGAVVQISHEARWLLCLPVCGVLGGLVSAFRRYGRSILKLYLLPASIAAMIWFVPLLFAATLGGVVGIEQEASSSTPKSPQNPMLPYLYIICFVSATAIVNRWAALGNKRSAATSAIFIVAISIVLSPRIFFAIPFRILRVADYNSSYYLKLAEKDDVSNLRRCHTVTIFGRTVNVRVRSNLGKNLVLDCGDNNWTTLPKSDIEYEVGQPDSGAVMRGTASSKTY